MTRKLRPPISYLTEQFNPTGLSLTNFIPKLPEGWTNNGRQQKIKATAVTLRGNVPKLRDELRNISVHGLLSALAKPANMFEKLLSFLRQHVPVTDEQFEYIKTLFVPKRVNKGEFLLREGEMTKYSVFVASGCLRTYTIDDKGKEHILQFSPENWWTGDMSFKSNIPSQCFIEALEDSEVLLIELHSIQKLNEYIPGGAAFYQAALQKSVAAKNQRIVSSLSATAEERYNDFLKKYPSLMQRVPQHMIASYLGITPETLSRIRKQQSYKH